MTSKIKFSKNDGLITLYKPNGKQVEVNKNSLEYAIKVLGWKKTKPRN